MATLDQFSSQRQASLESFQTQGSSVPVSNPASNKNIAAFTAAVSGDPESVESAYLNISGDLDVYGESEMGETLQRRAKEFSYDAERSALVSILTDPSISDEQKREASAQFLDQSTAAFTENFSVDRIVAETSLAESSGIETVEAEDVRVSFASAIDEVEEYRRWQQSVINQEAATNDPSLRSTIVDVIDIMLPFAEAGQVSRIRRKMEDGDLTGALRDTVFFGSAKTSVRDMIRSAPPEQRRVLAQAAIDIVNAESTIALPNENDMARMHQIRSFLEDGYYDDIDKWVDNIVGVLDVVALGGIVRGATRGVRGARTAPNAGMAGDFIPAEGPSPSGAPQIQRGITIEGEATDVTNRRIETTVQPVTLSQTYKNTNPGKARAAHQAAYRDETGEAAQALYGTSRTDAVANDLVGQIGSPTGRVRSKVSRPDAEYIASITPSPEVMNTVRADGGLHYWRQEKEYFDARVTNDFHNAFGLTARPEMFKYNRDGTTASVNATYGPMDSGWANAQDAVDLTAFNLRHYGVTEDQITVLMRQGDDYVPTKVEDVPEGATDFLVQVQTNVRMSADKIENFEEADVLRNFFDRFAQFSGESQGSLQRHLLDAHSMLHPNITLGANVAVDKANALEKSLLENLEPFTDIYTKLPKDRQQLVENIIKEANYNSRQPNFTELLAQGYSREEVQALREWKEFWDTQWWLENSDLRRTLSNRGYMMLENGQTGTRVYARPLSRNRAPQSARVYNDRTGEIVTMSRDEITKLYEDGGTLAQMRQPMRVQDEGVELILSEEKAGSSYLRAFNEDDAILNYREGYYQVSYTAPKFIDKIVKDSRGNELYRQAVGTAGNTRDAALMSKRMNATDGGEYVVRESREKMRMDGDDYWNLQLASGRSAQRVRGERLESATSINNTAVDHDFVLEPAQAAVNAARSISRRVRMRDYLETTKARFMQQYGEMLPRDQYGRPQYPGSITQIQKKTGTQRDKDVADARTTYEYIDSLENGYINSIDDAYKSLMRGIADIAGRSGLAKGEEAFHYLADSRGPMQFGRNTAFTLYLALNPLRQAIVQGHQAVQLVANFPRYAVGRMPGDVSLLMQMKTSNYIKGQPQVNDLFLKSTGRTEEEARFMLRSFDESGLSASIDKQNLVKGSLTELVEYSKYTGNAAGLVLKPVEWSRKIGFDAGENFNMMTAWLAHYNKRLEDTGKTYKQLNSEDLDWVTAQARSYTYNMNVAGEMPYNQNWMGAMMQFMQVPHKALTQMLTDRTLSRGEKLRLIGFNTAMYGVAPASVMYPWLENKLPEDGEFREMVLQGLESYTLNKFLTLTTGNETNLDYSGLAAADMTALWDLVGSMITTDIGTILAESPSGALFFGNNPRLTNFFKTVARYGNFVDDVQDPVTMKRIAIEASSLSSGMSNFWKARYIMKAGQKINSSGDVIVQDANATTAIAAMFGFQTRQEANQYFLSQKVYEETTEFRDDVRNYWRELTRHLTQEGVDKQSQEWTLRVITDMQRAWEGSPAAQDIILQEMQKGLEQGDDRLFRSIMNLIPLMDNEDVRQLARTMPDGELKEEMLRTLQFIDEYEDE